MKTIIACLMAWVMAMVVACVMLRAVDTMITLVWVGAYLTLALYMVTVWEDNMIFRIRTHKEESE